MNDQAVVLGPQPWPFFKKKKNILFYFFISGCIASTNTEQSEFPLQRTQLL